MEYQLRLGQAISVFGPGAIVDIGNGSFVNTTIDQWADPDISTRRYVECKLNRLSSRLGVEKLWQPTVLSEVSGRVPKSVGMMRFPQWMHCARCRHLDKWDYEKEGSLENGQEPICGQPCCKGKNAPLLPMRWVQICSNGHLSDVNWLGLLSCRSKNQCTNVDPTKLKLITFEGKGGTYEGMGIECTECGIKKNMRHFLMKIDNSKCSGIQPWLKRGQAETCEETMSLVQIGDTNIHFAKTVSALDIPESQMLQNSVCTWCDWDVLLEKARECSLIFDDLELVKSQQVFSRCCNEMNTTEHVVYKAIQDELCDNSGSSHVPDPTELESEIKRAELPALRNPEDYASPDYAGRHYAPDAVNFGTQLSELIESVSLIDRLREVRAFTGFRRSDPRGRLVPCKSKEQSWLPAMEVFGEGLFLSFSARAVSKWESSLTDLTKAKVDQLNVVIKESRLDDRFPRATPGFLAVHTFSHALMTQLAHECGYPTSSLRERLYPSGSSMGLLIYTANGDSEGTLGGLVRMAQPIQLSNLISKTLRSLAWCSADPICSESSGQGLAGLNEAACHACCLLPETSCEYSNALLNRILAIGNELSGEQGLFSAVFDELESKL